MKSDGHGWGYKSKAVSEKSCDGNCKKIKVALRFYAHKRSPGGNLLGVKDTKERPPFG